MLASLKEEEECISSELEEVPAVGVGDGQQFGEGGIEDRGHLLGSDHSLAGEPFGHRREAGDVDVDEGALDFPVALRVFFPTPPEHEPGEVEVYL